MPQEVKKSGETQEQFNLRLSVLQKSLELLTAAFAFVAALAWNDAIQAAFLRIFGPQSGLMAKFLYAFVITGIVVWIGYKLSKIQKSLEKKASGKSTQN